jgi:hypothetical protein
MKEKVRIDVRDFGATGTGDDTAAINNAISEAANTGGGIVVLPFPIIYTRTIYPKSGVILEGRSAAGMGFENVATTLYLIDHTNDHVIHVMSGVQYCQFRNLQINGNKANQSGTSCGIYFEDNSAPMDNMSIVERCYIHNVHDDGIYIGLNVQAVKILYNEILFCGNNGITIKGSDSHIRDNEIGENGSTGIWLNTWVTRIRDNDIWRNLIGINMDGGQFATISGNGIDRNMHQGIIIRGSLVTISENMLHTNSQAGNNLYASIDFQSGARGAVLLGNMFGMDPGYRNIPSFDINIHCDVTDISERGYASLNSSIQGHVNNAALLG